ncbi:MAG: PEP-CTERM sorting domain-containing protein [Pirellulales bacterium]|nr:PEP-CTERM sorting domain-containing protein [Pirellulales bacterium]
MDQRARVCLLLGVSVVLLLASQGAGVTLLTPGDPIIAVDAVFRSTSSSPAAEGPENLVDGATNTKYLNFAEENSGFIIEFAYGAAAVQSFQIATANDAPERDPTSWVLYGTNDAITSANHSLGDAENWTLLGSGDMNLPELREWYADPIAVSNTDTYSAYKMVFPTVRDAALANSMQISDVIFYDNMGGMLQSVLDTVLAIDVDLFGSGYPDVETPPMAIDNIVTTKYLNFGREGSGFIVTPSLGMSTLTGFQITTANDSESRDPATWELYGTNDSITSVDNSDGMAENWILIDSGDVTLPIERQTLGSEVAVENAAGYTSYKMVFPTVRDATAGDCDSMQIAEIQFFGTTETEPQPGDANRDGTVDKDDAALLAAHWLQSEGVSWSVGDFNDDGSVDDLDLAILAANWTLPMAATVPEPSTLALLGAAVLVALAARRRRS